MFSLHQSFYIVLPSTFSGQKPQKVKTFVFLKLSAGVRTLGWRNNDTKLFQPGVEKRQRFLMRSIGWTPGHLRGLFWLDSKKKKHSIILVTAKRRIALSKTNNFQNWKRSVRINQISRVRREKTSDGNEVCIYIYLYVYERARDRQRNRDLCPRRRVRSIKLIGNSYVKS